MPGSLDRGLGKTVDWSLVACYLVLVLIGWLNIYASIHSTEPSSILDWTARSGKQAVWIATAFLLDIFILFVINLGFGKWCPRMRTLSWCSCWCW